jgi:hypothetical protein
VPPWLASRMTTVGTAIAESVIDHYGPSAQLSTADSRTRWPAAMAPQRFLSPAEAARRLGSSAISRSHVAAVRTPGT